MTIQTPEPRRVMPCPFLNMFARNAPADSRPSFTEIKKQSVPSVTAGSWRLSFLCLPSRQRALRVPCAPGEAAAVAAIRVALEPARYPTLTKFSLLLTPCPKRLWRVTLSTRWRVTAVSFLPLALPIPSRQSLSKTLWIVAAIRESLHYFQSAFGE